MSRKEKLYRPRFRSEVILSMLPSKTSKNSRKLSPENEALKSMLPSKTLRDSRKLSPENEALKSATTFEHFAAPAVIVDRTGEDLIEGMGMTSTDLALSECITTTSSEFAAPFLADGAVDGELGYMTPKSDDILQMASDLLDDVENMLRMDTEVVQVNQEETAEQLNNDRQSDCSTPCDKGSHFQQSGGQSLDDMDSSGEGETEGRGPLELEDGYYDFNINEESMEQSDGSEDDMSGNEVEEIDGREPQVDDDIEYESNTRAVTQGQNDACLRVARKGEKESRSKGKAYMGLKKQESGKWVKVPRPAKAMKPPCGCKGSSKYKKFHCKEFDEETRKAIFNYFWKTKTWGEKRTFISAMIDVDRAKDTKNRKEKDTSRRSISLFFHLKKKTMRLRVCKKMFLNTLAISDWFAQSCCAKLTTDENYEREAETQVIDDEVEAPPPRKHPRARITPQVAAKMARLREFLKALNKMESHYCRKDTQKLYLEPIFQNKAEVYDLYVKETGREGLPVVTLNTFYHEFDKMKLSIYKPRKDQCDICVNFKVGNIPKDVYDEHQQRKELARNEMETDNDSHNRVFTMDLEGVLMSPRLMASAQYYKMKLSVHNFTLFDNKSKDVTCFLWHEGEGGVTSNEFASLIFSFVEELQIEPGQEVILWSDGCGYQNRNVNLANALSRLSQQKNVTIVQKFLERGHTQMTCDSIHAKIEKKLKNKLIYTPAGYIDVIENARKNPRPYTVKYVEHSFFKNFSSIGSYDSIRPGRRTGDPTVMDMCAIRYSPSGEIFYKLDFSEEWSLLEKRKKRSSSSSSPGAITQLYKTRPNIKPDKYNHLQQLKQSIPRDFHSFYDGLLH